MRRWLARFAFSLLIVAIVCAWEGSQIQRGYRGNPAEQQWKIYAYYAAAALSFGVGLRGMRERHRAQEGSDNTSQRPDEDP